MDGAPGPTASPRGFDVLEVLATRRVRAVSGGDERERALDAVVSHLADGVGQIRMPVAIAPVDGERAAGPHELGVEGSDEGSILRVDRAHSPEPLVLLGHDLQSLRRDVAPAGHVLEEGEDVVGALWPTERHHDHGVVRLGHGLSVADGVLTSCQRDADGNGHGSYASRRPSNRPRKPGAHHLSSPPAEPTCRIASQPAARGNHHRRDGPRHRRHRVIRSSSPSPPAPSAPTLFAPLSVMWIITFLAGPGLLPPRRARGHPCPRASPGDRQWRRARSSCERPSRRHARGDPRRHHPDLQPV